MKADKKNIFSIKLFVLTMICLITIGSHSIARANENWSFGIGTGFFGLNVDGTVGLNTTLAGAQEVEVDLSADDIMDAMESAFGIGGYATNGIWLIDYSVAYLKLEGDEASNAVITSAKIKYEASGFELLVGYPVWKISDIKISLHGGLRYTRHDIDSSLTIAGTILSVKIDEEWIDGVIGVSADIPVGKKWIWNSRITAGYGGSEGTYSAYSGLNWRFHKHWSTSFYGKYTAVEFEEGSKGDENWYLYDVDEFGAGFNVLFHW